MREMDLLSILQKTKTEEGRNSILHDELDLSGSKGSTFQTLCENYVNPLTYANLSFIERKRLLWIFRNCCFGDEIVISLVERFQVVEFLVSHCLLQLRGKLIGATGDETDTNSDSTELTDEESSSLLLIILQFFCNFASISPVSLALIHRCSGFQSILDLLALSNYLHSRASIATIWHLVYLMINKRIEGFEMRMEDLLSVKHRSLLCSLLLSLQQRSSTAKSEPSEQNNKIEEIENSIHDWSVLFLLQILQQKKLTVVFDLLDSRHSSLFITNQYIHGTAVTASDISIVNMEQIIFLHLLLSMTEDSSVMREMKDDTEAEENLINFIRLVLQKFHILLIEYNLWPDLTGTDYKPVITSTDPIKHSLYQDYCLLLLEYLSSIVNISHEDIRSHRIKEVLVTETSVIFDCSAKIEKWDFIYRRQREKDAAPSFTFTLSDFQKEFIRLSLQLFSHLFYQNQIFIETVMLEHREIIHTILCFCTTDVELPLVREWALLCVRNLCEQSEEIRNYINSLKPQEVKMDDEVLKRLNKEIRLDKDTGKLVVTEKKA